MYGIVDHTIPSGSDPIIGGFATIKVKVKNTTPGLSTAERRELMVEGTTATLRAVAKFHRNTCYKADLSGEYGSPGVNWQNWNANPMLGCGRNPVEEIVVSEPTPVPKGINNAAQAVTFRFIDQKIPISATDLFLQVIYRGPLGEETDAVVVATKDISEPTYIYHYTRWDQYRYKCPSWPAIDANFCGGNYSFEDWCTPAFPTVDACRETMGLTAKTKFAPDAAPISGYDPNANPQVPPETWADRLYEPFFSPLATLKAPVGTLARVAVLLDTAPANTQLMVFESIDPTHQSELFIWFTDASPSATINQVDPSTNSLVPSVRYLPGRGVFLPEQENFLLNSGEATPIPLLTLTPSRIDPTYLP